MSEVLDKVVEIVCNQLSVNKDDVTSDSSFVEDLGADSLDTVELVMAFEEEFGLEIPDDEAENITTIKSAVDWIQNNS
ncbi:MAG: acyl carrier protein [SAR86 cluster bacterium]|jgi:acyl carrier protein|uniref:Acyl carrier protein n=1 Tax=SAR86 cluster bacterium TaxID=2030880 RepID=A0A520MUT5_9GAMM|nr:MAG: acyl carrier protein [SAR86 cluster bacterium]|tara:strand:- start:274 stop:507 length:234 start_codon:yes stop_codon:yes gene_type:complete